MRTVTDTLTFEVRTDRVQKTFGNRVVEKLILDHTVLMKIPCPLSVFVCIWALHLDACCEGCRDPGQFQLFVACFTGYRLDKSVVQRL